MRLEIHNGGYFIFNETSRENTFEFQKWLYNNGFNGNIEYPCTRTIPSPFNSFREMDINYPTCYIENREEVGFLLNYRSIRTYYDNTYKTEFIKNGTCIVATGNHLIFLDNGEYEILPTGLKILPNE